MSFLAVAWTGEDEGGDEEIDVRRAGMPVADVVRGGIEKPARLRRLTSAVRSNERTRLATQFVCTMCLI